MLHKLWDAAVGIVILVCTGERRHPSMLPEDEDDPPLVRLRTPPDPPAPPTAPPTNVVITRIEEDRP